jgi:deoxycitidine kinase
MKVIELRFFMSSSSIAARRLSIEGNLAAGKSTLLKVLEMLDDECEIAPEPVTQWQHVADSSSVVDDASEESSDKSTALVEDDSMNILKMYYKDPTRWAHTF